MSLVSLKRGGSQARTKKDCPERREILLAAENDRREQLSTEKLMNASSAHNLNRRNAFLARRMRRQAQKDSADPLPANEDSKATEQKPRHFSEAHVLGGRHFVVIPTDPADDYVVPLSSLSTVDSPTSFKRSETFGSTLTHHSRTYTGSTADSSGSYTATAQRQTAATLHWKGVPPLSLCSLTSFDDSKLDSGTRSTPKFPSAENVTKVTRAPTGNFKSPREIPDPFIQQTAREYVQYDENTPVTKKGYNQFVAVKRVECASNNTVKIVEVPSSNKFLATSVDSTSFRDLVLLLPIDKVKQIIYNILVVYKAKGKPGPGTHLLNPQNIATRNPDIFWSLYRHFGSEDFSSGLKSLVTDSLQYV
eukprot:GHVP01019712.1.p1 GENE.GHVP01019712.1~~GHVP01019712.1.p1  ORF type:complete len:363 (+),score=42.99 GHVP01019712.1:23-1111(+)